MEHTTEEAIRQSKARNKSFWDAMDRYNKGVEADRAAQKPADPPPVTPPVDPLVKPPLGSNDRNKVPDLVTANKKDDPGILNRNYGTTSSILITPNDTSEQAAQKWGNIANLPIKPLPNFARINYNGKEIRGYSDGSVKDLQGNVLTNLSFKHGALYAGGHPLSSQIAKVTEYSNHYKQGGTMNRINYFQQGGAAPQQDIQKQIVALVQAAMQGDQKATQTVNQIMEAAKAGDQKAVQLAQMIQAVTQKMQGQATAAKWGAKLGYIRSLKYARGGKTCPACQTLEKGDKVEKKACGGKKAKKHYFGGWL